jgi:3-(3-hydroxy-phenyl)propionate hydroxylase
LKLVMDGKAPEKLLDSYTEERVFAADENLMNSTRSTDFITPKSKVSRTFRNAVLGLAKDHAFGRALVNSGRLSVPAFLTTSSLNTPDEAPNAFAGRMLPGAPMDDAPLRDRGVDCWLLDKVGNGFIALYFTDDVAVSPAPTFAALKSLAGNGIDVRPLVISTRPALRREARHSLSAASRPARRRALARVRCEQDQGRGGPRHLQRLTPAREAEFPARKARKKSWHSI